MTETFSFSSTITSAWNLVKTNWRFIVPATLVTALILLVMQVVQAMADRGPNLVAFLVTVIAVVLGIAITLGWANVLLKMIRGISQTWHDFKTDYRLWGHYFVAQIVYSLFAIGAVIIAVVPAGIVLLGGGGNVVSIILSILLFVAGTMLLVWIMVRYMFIPLVAIDHPKTNGWKLLKASAKLTKGHRIDLFGFMLLILFINLAGLLLFVVGLIVTIPLTKIAKTYVYQYLKTKHG